MKKLIITSVCTLGLSLIGAFGANQNSSNLNQLNNTNSDTTKVEENVTDINSDMSLPSVNQKTVANNAAVTDTKVNEATPQVMTAVTTKVAAAENNDATPKAQLVASKSKTTKYVYKNVDLSKCKTTNQVVKELQKNGYTNITSKNIKNIKSLKSICAAIQEREASKNTNQTTTTPTPTTKPAQTTTPTPTKKPTQTTTPAPTTKPSTTTNTGISNYANEVLRLVNVERSKAGLSAYTTNQTLTSAANKRAQEIVQSFSHTRPNGSSFSTVLKEFGVTYRTAGENIAYGQKTPQEVVTGWMNSSGHRANILNGNFNKIGIGVYQKNGVTYWTQLFTN